MSDSVVKTDSEMTMSNSRISTFNKCLREFFYKYVVKLPTKEKSYFILGTFVHYVLEIFFQRWAIDRERDLRNLMKECFIEAREVKFPNTDLNILNDAKNLLLAYLNRVLTKMVLPSKLETEKQFNIVVNGIKVTGFIDRIDYGNGGEITIIDYKTGSKAKSERELKEDLQLPIYALAMNQIYGIEPEKMTCMLEHIKVGKSQTVNPTRETISRAEHAIVQSYTKIGSLYGEMEEGEKLGSRWSEVAPLHIGKIKSYKSWSLELERNHLMFITRFSKYWEPNEGWHCKQCDFQRICKNTMW